MVFRYEGCNCDVIKWLSVNSPRLFICGTRAVDQYLSRPQVDLLGCGSAPAGECRQRRLSLRSVW